MYEYIYPFATPKKYYPSSFLKILEKDVYCVRMSSSSTKRISNANIFMRNILSVCVTSLLGGDMPYFVNCDWPNF